MTRWCEGEEECDDGNDVQEDACLLTVKTVCGDDVLRVDIEEGEDGYEACDDGNDVQEDACLNNCQDAQ